MQNAENIQKYKDLWALHTQSPLQKERRKKIIVIIWSTNLSFFTLAPLFGQLVN